MKWTLIDNDGFTTTHSMQVPGGTLYKVESPRGVALCFVPFMQAPGSTEFPYYSAPMTPHFTTPGYVGAGGSS